MYMQLGKLGGSTLTLAIYTPVKLVYLDIPSSKTCLFRHYHHAALEVYWRVSASHSEHETI